MIRSVLLGLLISCLFGVSAAASVELVNTSAELVPGQNQTVAEISINDSQNFTVTGVTDNFPFTIDLVNLSMHDNDTRATADVVASVPPSFPAGNYSHTVFVTLSHESVSVPISYGVASVSNWTVDTVNVSEVVSVGSRGSLFNFTVGQRGNVPVVLSTNVTGDLKDFVSVPSSISVPVGNPQLVDVTYRIPRSTGFGNYTGRIVLMDDRGVNRSITVSAVFEDRIRPELSGVVFPDVMATTRETFRLSARDNLNVSTVEAVITRSVNQGNETHPKIRNVSVVNASFNHEQNTDRWTYEYLFTDSIDTYYADIVATDSSGNTVNTSTSFQVRGLNATRVLHDNFNFTAAQPYDSEHSDRQAEHVVLRNSIDTAVTFNLTRFRYDNVNSTMQIGVLKPGNAVPTWFSLEKPYPTVDVTDKGVYSLVVRSDREQTFNGEISVVPVPQHHPVPGIEFTGSFVSPEYPAFGAYGLGSFNGTIEPITNENGVTTGAKVVLEQKDISDCKGVATWSACIPGWSLGEMPEKSEEVRLSRNSAGMAWTIVYAAIGFVVLFTVFLVRTRQLEGLVHVNRSMVFEMLHRDNGEDVENDQNVLLARIVVIGIIVLVVAWSQGWIL